MGHCRGPVQARPATIQGTPQTITVPQEHLCVPGDDNWDQRAKPEVHSYDLWTCTNIGENFLNPITPLSATLWPTFFVFGRPPSSEERSPAAPSLSMPGERSTGVCMSTRERSSTA